MASRQVTTVVRALNRFLEGIIRKLTLDVVANLTRAPSEGGTPVDTGWARSNWIPSVSASVDKTTGSKLAVSGNAQAAGIARVGAYRLRNGNTYVSNNVPYIVFLDQGSSRQAPAGFVRAAIQRSISQVGR